MFLSGAQAWIQQWNVKDFLQCQNKYMKKESEKKFNTFEVTHQKENSFDKMKPL